ncbi:MAG: HAD family hydrolase [Phycisphaerae bacterium]|jgi:putative hydrolase of the HAD superfamily
MINTVIFDLDDTLYDEIDYCKSGFAAIADFLHNANPSIPRESFYKAIWNQFENNNRTSTFNAALASFNLPCDEKIINELVAVYREHQPNISLPPDSKKILEQFKGLYNLALLTDGFMPAQRLKAEALGIIDYFSCIVYTEELGREFWKPSPAGFEKILKHFSIHADLSVYVADNVAKDFIAPNSLGMASVRVIRPNTVHSNKSTDPQQAPQHTINSLAELPALLRKL